MTTGGWTSSWGRSPIRSPTRPATGALDRALHRPGRQLRLPAGRLFHGRQYRRAKRDRHKRGGRSRRAGGDYCDCRHARHGDNDADNSNDADHNQKPDAEYFASLLASQTPDPHPTGDPPSDSASTVTLTDYTPRRSSIRASRKSSRTFQGLRADSGRHLQESRRPPVRTGANRFRPGAASIACTWTTTGC